MVGKNSTDKVMLNADKLAVFQSLKRALCSGTQLAHLDLLKQFVVHTYASKFAVGDVLLQRSDDGIERPISLCSKKLLSPQQNLSTFERECLAIVDAVFHFRVYLLARPFLLRTDHQALTSLFSKEFKASARTSSWIATLLEYIIVVEFIKGTENTFTDVLSRFKGHAVDQIVPSELANSTISFVCPASDADRLKVQTHWLTSSARSPQSLE